MYLQAAIFDDGRMRLAYATSPAAAHAAMPAAAQVAPLGTGSQFKLPGAGGWYSVCGRVAVDCEGHAVPLHAFDGLPALGLRP